MCCVCGRLEMYPVQLLAPPSVSATAVVYACWFVNWLLSLLLNTVHLIEIYFAHMIVTRYLRDFHDNYNSNIIT